MKKEPQYLIRIIYKSGCVQEFRCTKFQWERVEENMTVTWKAADDEPCVPIYLGAAEIAAVWKVKDLDEWGR